MTDERVALLDLVEKSVDADLVHDMLAFAAERIMDADVESLFGVGRQGSMAVREDRRPRDRIVTIELGPSP